MQAGITDLHYLRYDDDIDIDSVQYGIYSSSPSLYASKYKNTYFHPGANLPNIHYDDPATFPAAGIDLVSCIGSGPYRVAPGDTLHFVTAFIAAIDAAGMDAITKNAWDLYRANFATPKPPATPKVKVVSGDGRATITWDNAAESSRDPDHPRNELRRVPHLQEHGFRTALGPDRPEREPVGRLRPRPAGIV